MDAHAHHHAQRRPAGGRPGMDGTIEMAGRELKILEIWRENLDMAGK